MHEGVISDLLWSVMYLGVKTAFGDLTSYVSDDSNCCKSFNLNWLTVLFELLMTIFLNLYSFSHSSSMFYKSLLANSHRIFQYSFYIIFPSFLSLFLFVSSCIHLSAFQHANFFTSLFVSLITQCLNDKSQLTSTEITMFTFICWHFWSHFFKYFNSHFSHQNFTKISSCYLFKKWQNILNVLTFHIKTKLFLWSQTY